MRKLTPWILAAALLIPAASTTLAASGKANYTKYCNGCHKNISDKKFKNQNIDKLTAAVISGAGGKMKPRGGTRLSDADLKAAVEYLISK